jgi:phage baseplate assembly protein W
MLYNFSVIRASLRRIFTSHIGSHSRIFQGEFGSRLLDRMQDPINQVTAMLIQEDAMAATSRLETRAVFSLADLTVTPDYKLNGYRVTINYSVPAVSSSDSFSFSLKVSNNG